MLATRVLGNPRVVRTERCAGPHGRLRAVAHHAGDTTPNVIAEGVNDHERPPRRRHMQFRVLREGAGFIATPESSRWCPTRSRAGPGDSDLERMLPAVGVAVLFAEDLFARSISLPGIGSSEGPELWGSCGLCWTGRALAGRRSW